jgi:hypothetical protein
MKLYIISCSPEAGYGGGDGCGDECGRDEEEVDDDVNADDVDEDDGRELSCREDVDDEDDSDENECGDDLKEAVDEDESELSATGERMSGTVDGNTGKTPDFFDEVDVACVNGESGADTEDVETAVRNGSDVDSRENGNGRVVGTG